MHKKMLWLQMDTTGGTVDTILKRKKWTYTLNNQYECDDNNITHWAEPPILPHVS